MKLSTLLYRGSQRSAQTSTRCLVGLRKVLQYEDRPRNLKERPDGARYPCPGYHLNPRSNCKLMNKCNSKTPYIFLPVDHYEQSLGAHTSVTLVKEFSNSIQNCSKQSNEAAGSSFLARSRLVRFDFSFRCLVSRPTYG